MKLPLFYTAYVQICIRCPQGLSRISACGIDGIQYHHHANSGVCPDGRYGVNLPIAEIDPDYTPTPANATKGRCCS